MERVRAPTRRPGIPPAPSRPAGRCRATRSYSRSGSPWSEWDRPGRTVCRSCGDRWRCSGRSRRPRWRSSGRCRSRRAGTELGLVEVVRLLHLLGRVADHRRTRGGREHHQTRLRDGRQVAPLQHLDAQDAPGAALGVPPGTEVRAEIPVEEAQGVDPSLRSSGARKTRQERAK